MKTIDEEILFHLSQNGWYLGNTKIEISNEIINGVEIITETLDAGNLACFRNGKIFISKALATFASLPQRRLAILHEYAHSQLKLNGVHPHDKEYACDKWALKEMFNSGKYNLRELYNAIELFREVIDDGETKTHPSSKNRYKRLLNILKETIP